MASQDQQLAQQQQPGQVAFAQNELPQRTKSAPPLPQELTQAERLAMYPPRAEGYRPPVIRESRIKDRPYKPMNDSLSIKIELDLEVEVCYSPPPPFRSQGRWE